MFNQYIKAMFNQYFKPMFNRYLTNNSYDSSY